MDTTPKPWYQSKTLLLNALAFLIAAVGLVTDTFTLTPDAAKWAVLLVGLLNLLLRFVTSQPIEGSPADPYR